MGSNSAYKVSDKEGFSVVALTNCEEQTHFVIFVLQNVCIDYFHKPVGLFSVIQNSLQVTQGYKESQEPLITTPVSD